MMKMAENVVLATCHQRALLASYVRVMQMAGPVQPAVAHFGGVCPAQKKLWYLSIQASKQEVRANYNWFVQKQERHVYLAGGLLFQ